MSNEQKADCKIILLGDSNVGKTKLVERYLMSDYNPQESSTYALSVFRHKHVVDGKKYMIEFWDTGGQDRFNSMHPSYYHRADCCILTFSVGENDIETYQHLKGWYAELKKYRPNIKVIVVANKIDMRPEATEQPFGFAIKRKLPLMYCSAADGTNVVQLFEEAIRLAVDMTLERPETFEDDVYATLDYFEKKEQQGKTDS